MSLIHCAPRTQRSNPTAATITKLLASQSVRARTDCRVTLKVAPIPMQAATAATM